MFLKGQCIGMEALQSWWFHWQWNHNETKGLHGFTVHGVDSRHHTCQLGTPQKYTEGWSSENKRICVLTKHLWLSEQKPDMFALKLKFILLPQLIATLITMHVHCLHWLMWTGLLSLNAFCRPCKPTTGEMVPKEGSKLAVGTWYGSHCQCTSV